VDRDREGDRIPDVMRRGALCSLTTTSSANRSGGQSRKWARRMLVNPFNCHRAFIKDKE
jgi:hypothetical protein